MPHGLDTSTPAPRWAHALAAVILAASAVFGAWGIVSVGEAVAVRDTAHAAPIVACGSDLDCAHLDWATGYVMVPQLRPAADGGTAYVCDDRPGWHVTGTNETGAVCTPADVWIDYAI